ncbi:MAG: UvrB/UvrC motif-containing protein [Bacteroidales bacterium]
MKTTRNYKKFWALLKLTSVRKEDLILAATHGRTNSLRELTDAEYNEVVAQMEEVINEVKAKPYNALDKPRKRVIAAVHAWLVATGKTDKFNISLILSVACRAAQVEAFNSIGLDRLNSLYNAFVKRKKDLEAVAVITPASTVEVLSVKLQEVAAEENYEKAVQLRDMINEFTNEAEFAPF